MFSRNFGVFRDFRMITDPLSTTPLRKQASSFWSPWSSSHVASSYATQASNTCGDDPGPLAASGVGTDGVGTNGVDTNQGSNNGDGSHGDGNHPEILEKLCSKHFYISMFLMVLGGLYGLKSCPGIISFTMQTLRSWGRVWIDYMND